jgi:hypothetical protein
MSRTSANITETEKATYTEFCSSYHILDDESPAGIQNGEHIGGYIALWDVDITEETLKVALEKLSDRLVFIPAEQTEVADILLHLDQGQRDIVANWLCPSWVEGRRHQKQTAPKLHGRGQVFHSCNLRN